MKDEELSAAGLEAVLQLAADFKGSPDGYPTDEEMAILHRVSDIVADMAIGDSDEKR